MEVLGEGQPAHQVAGEVAPAHLDAVRVGLADAGDRAVAQSPRSSRTSCAPATIASSLRKASVAREVLHAAVGRDDEPLGRNDGERGPDPAGDDLRGLGLARAQVEHAEQDRLARQVAQHLRVEPWLCGLERDVRRAAAVELAQERVAGEPVVDDRRVAEARVQDRVALDPFERPVDRLDRVLARRLGPCLEVRLVDLDDVGPGRLQVVELLVDGLRVGEREAPLVVVVVVLRLLGHRERPGNGDLDPAVGERAQELDVADLDRARAADRAYDLRDRVLVPRAIEGDARVVEVDAVERGREAVGVALAPHLAVGDHVDAGPLHVGDREPGRVVLRLLELRLRHAPELTRAHARRQPVREPLPVDQPVRLRVAPDNRGEERFRQLSACSSARRVSTRARCCRNSALAAGSLGGLVPSAARSAALAGSEPEASASSTPCARTGVGPMFVSATRAEPFEATAATPTVAQSCARRWNLT